MHQEKYVRKVDLRTHVKKVDFLPGGYRLPWPELYLCNYRFSRGFFSNISVEDVNKKKMSEVYSLKKNTNNYFKDKMLCTNITTNIYIGKPPY